MLSLFQKIVGVLPVVFIIIAISALEITQTIWIKRNYIVFILCFFSYSLFSLWTFKFNLLAIGFITSLFPFIYLGYCFLFGKLFLKIKYERIQRTFPVYVLFYGEGDDMWSKKIAEGPESADRMVSGGLALATIFTILGLLGFIL